MNDTNNRFHLSVSGMRRYAECGYAYKLSRDGAPRRSSAAAWFGSLMHRIIERAYSGATPTDAHEQVWAAACGSILDALDRWSDLHLLYQASGRPNTKARDAWLLSHPDYTTLAAHLATYQADVLGMHTWSSRASVEAYYLSSRTLVREHGAELLLPHPVLVEGKQLAPLPDGRSLEPVAMETEDEDEPPSYGLLQGTIGGTTVVGVPDVVAYDPRSRCWRIADYKTSRTMLSPAALREDAQLNVYLVLLYQAGLFQAGSTVEIGHIYLSETIQAVWIDISDRVGTIPPRLIQQVTQTRAMVEAGIFMPVRGLLNGYSDRCEGCFFSHVCDA